MGPQIGKEQKIMQKHISGLSGKDSSTQFIIRVTANSESETTSVVIYAICYFRTT